MSSPTRISILRPRVTTIPEEIVIIHREIATTHLVITHHLIIIHVITQLVITHHGIIIHMITHLVITHHVIIIHGITHHGITLLRGTIRDQTRLKQMVDRLSYLLDNLVTVIARVKVLTNSSTH